MEKAPGFYLGYEGSTPSRGAIFDEKRSSIVELNLHAVRQINGDLRIDDGDEGPMLKIEFFDTWDTDLTYEDKDQILEAVVMWIHERLTERRAE